MSSEQASDSPPTRHPPPASRQSWWRRFLAKGVFWRKFLRFAAMHVPPWIEPLVIACWAGIFLLFAPGRQAVMSNLKRVKKGSTPLANFFRCYRVFWNYAWSLSDTMRFREMRVVPDWEFTGYQHFEVMQATGGAVLLSAHMGSYDLAAYLLAERSGHRVIIVRAPEVDPETDEYEKQRKPAEVQTEFNVKASDLAIDLLHAVRDGGIVAIHGDRVAANIGELPATLFGEATRLPAGPFALAMSSHAPIHPIFIVRTGRRRYRVVAYPPIVVEASRDRNAAFGKAMAAWTRDLEDIVSKTWYQWYAFVPLWPEAT